MPAAARSNAKVVKAALHTKWGGTAKESFALCCILLFYAAICSQQSMPPCKKKPLAIALEDGEEQLGSSH